MFRHLKVYAQQLKTEITVLACALPDPCTPWSAKVLAALVIAYAASPIDFIPDFIPVLGQLDDLILLPLGIALVIKLIPQDVLDEHRENISNPQLRGGRLAALGIILIWLVVIISLLVYLFAAI